MNQELAGVSNFLGNLFKEEPAEQCSRGGVIEVRSKTNGSMEVRAPQWGGGRDILLFSLSRPRMDMEEKLEVLDVWHGRNNMSKQCGLKTGVVEVGSGPTGVLERVLYYCEQEGCTCVHCHLGYKLSQHIQYRFAILINVQSFCSALHVSDPGFEVIYAMFLMIAIISLDVDVKIVLGDTDELEQKAKHGSLV
ncbi:hypothetical protein Tco_0603756 [Tanacetum coccineum]